MKTILVFLFLSYVSLLFESTWCIFCSLYFLHIDPLPALICWLSLKEDFWPGTLAVTVCGLMACLFSCLKFFLFPLAYLIGFFTVYFIRINMLELSKLQAYLITGFISIEMLVVQLAGSGSPELLWPWGLIQAVINFVIAPVVFWLCNKCLAALSNMVARFRHEKGN